MHRMEAEEGARCYNQGEGMAHTDTHVSLELQCCKQASSKQSGVPSQPQHWLQLSSLLLSPLLPPAAGQNTSTHTHITPHTEHKHTHITQNTENH